MREVFSLNRECRVLHGIESAQGLKNSDRPMDIFVIVNNFFRLLILLMCFFPIFFSISDDFPKHPHAKNSSNFGGKNIGK